MSLTPFLGAGLAIVAWGSFTVPSKAATVAEADLHPLWFQLYVSVGVSLSSFLFLLIEPSSISDLTIYGLVSAAMWVTANSAAMFAVKILGIATAQSTWGALIAIISFTSSLLFRDEPKNLPLAWLGVFVLIVGIGILAYVSSKSTTADRRGSSLASKPLLGVGSDGSSSPSKPPSKLSGFLCILITGLFAGTIFIPLRLAPSRYRDGLQAISFSFSQGLSTLPVASVFVPLCFLCRRLLSPSAGPFLSSLPPPHFRTCLLPGALSGLLWNLGNLGATLSTLPPLQAVGYPITQSALLVGCAWGVYYFGEIRGEENVRIFWAGAVVTMVGLVVTGWYGQCE